MSKKIPHGDLSKEKNRQKRISDIGNNLAQPTKFKQIVSWTWTIVKKTEWKIFGITNKIPDSTIIERHCDSKHHSSKRRKTREIINIQL